jgi:hypothetical protein
MANKVISTAVIGQVINAGKTVKIGYATKTDTWIRSHLSQGVQDEFKKALEKANIPANAASATMA